MVLLGALALTFGMNSCSDYDNGYTSKDIAYKEQFYNMFGNADPNHTWNMAQSRSLDVTINSEGTYTVKVWTANPRLGESNAFLLGQYDHVPGGATSSFACDMPQDVTTAYVGIIDENGDRIIEPVTVKDGKASVSFGVLGTRAVLPTNGSELFSDAGKDKEFQEGDLYVPLKTLPESQNNTDKVSQNFEYASTGEFVIYPIYAISSNAGSDGKGHRLGIYLCDADGNKTGDITWIWQSTVDDNGETGTATWFDAYNSSTNQWDTDLFAFSKERNLKGWADTNGDGNIDAIDRVENPVVVWDTDSFISPYTKIRPEGIRINVPKGTRFGMVLDASGGGPYYSNSQYNGDDVYGATFKDANGNLYLAFEDWNHNSGGDKDFNDIVFIVPKEDVNKAPVIIDKETEDISMSYIVACEDLGGTFDWDFNDVVYAIEHVSGQTTARIKLLAAGGTLPVKISYKDQFIKFSGEEDLHEAFGVDLNTPVNVGGYTANPLYSDEFTVDANAFSMSTHASDFKIHVDYTDGSKGAQIGVPDRSAGQEPQAFLVADPNWQWPNEKVSITSMYSQFTEWVADLNTNWCGSVWGAGNSDVIIQNGTNFNLFEFDNASWYNGNVATIPLDKNQMSSKTAYQIVLTTSKDAVVQFKQSDGTKVELTNSDVIAGERNIFTLQGEALEALKGGCMTITFSDEVQITSDNCETLITELRWVESKAKPTLTANSMTFTVGDEARQIELTSNADDVFSYTYESSNESVATVSQNGIVTPVASGTAYITVKQSETGNYQAATVRVTVTVNANTANLQDPGLGFGSTLSLNANYKSQSENINTNSDGAITVTCSDNSVVNVELDGKQMQITALKAGTATITVKQEATSTYAAAEKTMTVTVQASDPNLNINDNLSWDATNDKTNSLSFNTQSDGAITIENSDASVVTADLGDKQINFTALKAGTATITVKQAASAFYAEATKTVTVTVTGNFDNEGSQGGSTELTGTPLTVTKATDTPKHENTEVSGTWYKLSAAQMYAAVGNNDSNGVILEFKLHNSGITSFYMGNDEKCKLFVLKDGNSDAFHSVELWGVNVTVQWNGEWSEVNGIPARTLIVTIPDRNLWINGVVGYDYNNNTYNKDLYFGGNAGDQDATIQATIRPKN